MELLFIFNGLFHFLFFAHALDLRQIGHGLYLILSIVVLLCWIPALSLSDISALSPSSCVFIGLFFVGSSILGLSASRYDGAVVCSLLSGADRPAPANSTLAAVNSSHGKIWNEFQ